MYTDIVPNRMSPPNNLSSWLLEKVVTLRPFQVTTWPTTLQKKTLNNLGVCL